MTTRATSRIRQLYANRWLHIAVLAAAPFLVYSNNYRHEYQLDDAYTIVTNTNVRSLTLAPRYFVDPATYTSIREQADYRPILQLTYALNYRLSGYAMWSWHLTQILLHALVTLGLYALCRRILQLIGDPTPDRIAFAAALIFAVHPAASGVVNYLNARSSLLTAAFILPALLAYMRPVESPADTRPQWRSAAFYTLALFTKVEAVGALGAFWAFELWTRQREAPDGTLARAIRASFDGRTLRRLAPALAITVVYFVLRARVMAPFPFEETRHAADVGAYEYFLTQLTAWWYYVYRWVAPVRLVADYLAYPVYRSWSDPTVLLAASAWIVVLALLMASWRRAPYLLVLALASLALLSPTSSIAPLAEMVNEHRPYLPIGILSLAAVIPIGTWLRRWPRDVSRSVLTVGGGAMLLSLGALTYRRNTVFATPMAYWEDVIAKAPSSRAHMNYGLALMRANDVPAALVQFRRSLEIAPYWYYTHINMGIAFQHVGQPDSARASFDRAVQYDRYSGLALTYRGEFRLAQRDYAGARDDFLQSSRVALHPYRNAKGLAAAYAALGDTAGFRAATARMLALDPVAAAADTPALTTTSEAGEMARGLAELGNGRAADAVAAFRRVLALNPTHYGAHYQLAAALDRLGKRDEARIVWQRVLTMAEGYRDTSTARVARARLR